MRLVRPPSGRCRCTENEVQKYLSRLSGPLLDRIDLFVEVDALDFEELAQREPGESSAAVKERVDRARAVQNRREGCRCSAHMDPSALERFCALDDSCQKIMRGPLPGWASPPAAMTASAGWPGPSLTWTAPRTSSPSTWPRPCNTARRSICAASRSLRMTTKTP